MTTIGDTQEVDGVTFTLTQRAGGALPPTWRDPSLRVEMFRAYRGTTYTVQVDGKEIGSGYRSFEGAARAAIKAVAS